MSNPNFRYWLRPTRPTANEAIATILNQRSESAQHCEDQSITVGGNKIYGVYIVSHDIVTLVGNSEHRKFVQAFVQEGEGQIRSNFLYENMGRSLNRTQPVKKAQAALGALMANKK